MEGIIIFLKTATIFLNPMSLGIGLLVFVLSLVIIMAYYDIPIFRKLLQGPDGNFILDKAADFEEAIHVIDLKKLTATDRKKMGESLTLVKLHVDDLLNKL